MKRGGLYGAIIGVILGILAVVANFAISRPTVFVLWSIADAPIVAFQSAILGALVGAVVAVARTRGISTSKKMRFSSWLLIGAISGLIFGLLISAFIVLGLLKGDLSQALPIGFRGVSVGMFAGVIGGAILGFMRRK